MPLDNIVFPDLASALASASVAKQIVDGINNPLLDPANASLAAAGNIAMVAGQKIQEVNKTVGGATTVTLPPAPVKWQMAVVKDGKGDAATNNITCQGAAGNIDGAASVAINANYGALMFMYNGTEWKTIAEVNQAGGSAVFGSITLTGSLIESAAGAVSAAGTTQAGATALTLDNNRVTTVAAGAGVALPAATVGRNVKVLNAGANALVVYPINAGTDAINNLAANVGFVIPVGQASEFTCATTGIWTTPVFPHPPGRTTSAPTNITAVMANLTDLTLTVAAGQKVVGELFLIAKNSTGAEGLQIDFGGGTATFTSVFFAWICTPVGATLGTKISAALATALTATTVDTTDEVYHVYFEGVVNAAGTVIPRFAEVSHTSGTATVEIGSTFGLTTTQN